MNRRSSPAAAKGVYAAASGLREMANDDLLQLARLFLGVQGRSGAAAGEKPTARGDLLSGRRHVQVRLRYATLNKTRDDVLINRLLGLEKIK
jgi:hypothetical protein